MGEMVAESWASFAGAAEKLVWLSVLFGLLGLLVKRAGIAAAFRRSMGETRLNLVYWAVDALAVAPAMGAAALTIERLFAGTALASQGAATLALAPPWVALLLGIALSDFVGYWRHRLLHIAALWPAHAIHHSDRAMTWLTLIRMHPIDRLATTAINMAALAALGFPAWMIATNAVLRNLYGFFIHADLPWRYGPLARVFVSPALHRWHHAREVAGTGSNFATIFAFYDVAFGTWYLPARPPPALGIDEPGFAAGWAGQMLWPFRAWWRTLRQRAGEATAHPAG